jgi:hypothetical protein
MRCAVQFASVEMNGGGQRNYKTHHLEVIELTEIAAPRGAIKLWAQSPQSPKEKNDG